MWKKVEARSRGPRPARAAAARVCSEDFLGTEEPAVIQKILKTGNMEQDLTDHAWRSSTLVCCHRTSSSTTLVLAGACLPSLIGRIVVALASSCAHRGRVAVRASDLGLDIIISFATRGSDLPPTPAISMWRGAEATGSDPHKVVAPNRAEEATTVPPPQPPMGVGWIREQLAASLKEEFPGRYATARRADARKRPRARKRAALDDEMADACLYRLRHSLPKPCHPLLPLPPPPMAARLNSHRATVASTSHTADHGHLATTSRLGREHPSRSGR